MKKRFTIFVLLGLLCCQLQAAVKVVATLSESKRLSEFLTDYIVTKEVEVYDENGMVIGTETVLSHYKDVTEIVAIGGLTDEDLTTLQLLTVIEKMDLSQATLPSNTLPAQAFYIPGEMWGGNGIHSLREVLLPPSITTIGTGAFMDCINLKTINFKELVNLEKIESNAFMESGITSVYLGAKCTKLSVSSEYMAGSFWNMYKLEKIEVDPANTVYESYENGLYDKAKQTLMVYPKAHKGKVIIKEGTKNLGYRAFFEAEGITEVQLPNSLTALTEMTFMGCTALTKVNIPTALTTIGDGVFHSSKITSLTLPSTLTAMGVGAFENMTALTSINIPASITALEDRTFMSCESLEEVKFENTQTLNYIGSSAFQDCKSLKSIDLSKATSIKEINLSVFEGCSSLKTASLPTSVTTLNTSAFADCSSLDFGTNFPSQLKNIGELAFSNNTSLSSIHIGENIETIGTGAFMNCIGVKNITVEDNNFYVYNAPLLATIDGSEIIFAMVDNAIESLDLRGVTRIGNTAFANYTSLKEVKFDETLTFIGERAFYNNTSLNNVDLSLCKNLAEIGEEAFGNTTAMKNITFPGDNNSVTVEYVDPEHPEDGSWEVPFSLRILEKAFYQSAISTLELPLQVNLLGNYVFAENTELVSADLSRCKMGNLSEGTFMNCTSLSSVKLNNQEIWGLGTKTFVGCTALKTFEIPDNIGFGMNGSIFEGSGLTSFTVAKDNYSLKAVDGILYDAQETTLMGYPVALPAEVYTLPTHVTKIGSEALMMVPALKRIKLHDQLEEASFSNILASFAGLHNLTDFEVSENNPFYAVHDGALYSKDLKTLYAFPGGRTEATFAPALETIESKSFWANGTLAEVIIPEGVTKLSFNAFQDAFGLTHVELPSTITEFSSVFINCPNLATVTCKSTTPPTIDYFAFGEKTDIEVSVPEQALSDYRSAEGWKNLSIVALTTGIESVSTESEVVISYRYGSLLIASETPVSRTQIYDLSGSLIYSGNDLNIDLNLKNQLVIVRILLNNGNVISRKVML